MIRKGNVVAYETMTRDGLGLVLATDRRRVFIKTKDGNMLIINKDQCIKVPKCAFKELGWSDK